MAQKDAWNLSTLTFHNTRLKIIDREGQQWLTGPDIARALGYATGQPIAHLYNRYCDEFTPDMSVVLKLNTTGNLKVPTRIFSKRGAHLIAMFARSSKAKAFRKWVLDVLEARQKAPAVTHHQPSYKRGWQAGQMLMRVRDAEAILGENKPASDWTEGEIAIITALVDHIKLVRSNEEGARRALRTEQTLQQQADKLGTVT